MDHVLVLVPAHNEADAITDTLGALEDQTRPADRVVVVADNCTDETSTLSRAAGAEVLVTVGNRDKKAGALNQALSCLLATLADSDCVLIVDADSRISPRFLEVAVQTLHDDSDIGAVGGIFLGEPGGGLLGALQRNEYLRYQRQIRRRHGDALVLTGTATLHRVRVLRHLIEVRGTAYDPTALTEDNEITLAIKTLGLQCVSPPMCLVETEVMPTWRDLWNQRLRWQRGALENLRAYGVTRVTAPYAAQQLGMGVGVMAMWLYLGFTAHLAAAGELGVRPWWTAVAAVFFAERLVSVWHGGPAARRVALPFVLEWGYDLFLQAVLIRASFDVLLRRPARWHHVASTITT
jgi:biofilm PGA synthesis N-glycosyltransferase PgaC